MEKKQGLKRTEKRPSISKLRLIAIAFILLAGGLACNIGLIPSKIQAIPTVMPGTGCSVVDPLGTAGVDDSCQKKQEDVNQLLTDWSDPKPTSQPGSTGTPNCNPLPAQTAVMKPGSFVVSPEQSQKEQRVQETRYPGQCKGGRFVATATPFAERTPTAYDTKGFTTPTKGR